MSEHLMEKYDKQKQKLLAIWAFDCAQRVISFFEEFYPKDNRPKIALETLQDWINTGIFKMSDIRKAALDSHAAARESKNDNSCFAARSAGQAVATAHVSEHAFSAAYYAVKAIAASNHVNVENKISEEFGWQLQHFPKDFLQEWYDWQSLKLPKSLKQIWKKSISN